MTQEESEDWQRKSPKIGRKECSNHERQFRDEVNEQRIASFSHVLPRVFYGESRWVGLFLACCCSRILPAVVVLLGSSGSCELSKRAITLLRHAHKLVARPITRLLACVEKSHAHRRGSMSWKTRSLFLYPL